MSLRRSILPSLATAAALALGACNHEASQARLDALPQPGAAGAARQVLAFSDDGANAKLASTEIAAGAAGVMLECEHGGRLVHLTQATAGREAATMVLSADGRRSSLPAQPQTFEGRRLLTADTASDDPALAGFRRSATLRIEDGDRSLTVTVQDGRSGAERFFDACEARV